MDDSDLLAFTPVPAPGAMGGRRRSNISILGLARGLTAARAAGLLGLSRKTAYELRRKPGAGFAAAWDAAVEQARLSSSSNSNRFTLLVLFDPAGQTSSGAAPKKSRTST